MLPSKCLFMHDPCEPHLALVKRILPYVNNTLNNGLQIGIGPVKSLIDWAGCLDSRRSATGYCVFHGYNLVSWSSKIQSTMSRSSAQAEYRDAAHVVAEFCWLRQLMHEVHIPIDSTTVTYCDQ